MGIVSPRFFSSPNYHGFKPKNFGDKIMISNYEKKFMKYWMNKFDDKYCEKLNESYSPVVQSLL